MSDFLLQTLRYNRWANLHLLDACSGLTEQQLELSSAGTYGSIAATWMHLLGAEQRYLRRLTGSAPHLAEDMPFPGIAALKEQAAQSGDQLIAAIGRSDPDGTSPREGGGVRNWVALVQAIHHGNDHRTHICTILGQNDISYGDMDVWAFADTEGGYVKC